MPIMQICYNGVVMENIVIGIFILVMMAYTGNRYQALSFIQSI